MSSLWSVRIWVKSASLPIWPISASLFSLRKPLHVAERLVQRAQGVVEVGGAVGQHLRHRGDVVGELHDLLVAVRQRVDEHLQIADGAEQVGAGVTQPARGLRQLAQRLPERVAVAVEGVGGLVDERASAGPASIPAAGRVACSAAVSCSLTSSHSTGTAVRSRPDLGAVGHHRATGVGRGELNEPGRHQVRRDDERLGVGGQLDAVLAPSW